MAAVVEVGHIAGHIHHLLLHTLTGHPHPFVVGILAPSSSVVAASVELDVHMHLVVVVACHNLRLDLVAAEAKNANWVHHSR